MGESLHRCDCLGGPERAQFSQKDLWILGWGASVSRPVLATVPGEWKWESGSNPADPGLSRRHGEFKAVAWSEEEKKENPLRRGFLRATANRHAIEQADGTPFFVIGDTWYSTGTNRFLWKDDNQEHPLGPDAGFKDYLRYRKAQGYNAVLIIAAFPAWATDGYPVELFMDNPERTCVRSASTVWNQECQDMENEGGRAFLFPGKVPGFEQVFPDLDRINPTYFHYLDRKIDYLNEQGFIPFIEVARRDTGQVWKKYHSWPDSYARYIQYVWSRYQANNTVFSPHPLRHRSRYDSRKRLQCCGQNGYDQVWATTVRHVAYGQFEPIVSRKLWRRFLGDAAPDGQRAGA